MVIYQFSVWFGFGFEECATDCDVLAKEGWIHPNSTQSYPNCSVRKAVIIQ